jgi:hypothetical protein
MQCSSELPLLVEFLVRRGDKQLFIRAVGEASPNPGLTLLLMQLEEMITLNFTLFTDEEYAQLPTAIASVMQIIADLEKRPKPGSTMESNTVFHVLREIPELCDSIIRTMSQGEIFVCKGLLVAGDEPGGKPGQK